jgi:hypothetical protein
MYSCEFCNASLGRKSSLLRHQKTSNKCLKLQTNVEVLSYKCEFCSKELSTLISLREHKTKCLIQKNMVIKTLSDKVTRFQSKFKDEKKKSDLLNIKLKNQEKTIIELQNANKDLQDRIERMCVKAIEKPTTTKNKTVNKFNLSVFPSQRDINNTIECKFTDKYMLDGITGVAQFVYDHIIKLEDGSIAYACFDRSRKIFKFKDANGIEIKDPYASKLISMLKNNLLKQNRRVLDFFNVEVNNMSYLRDRDGEIDENQYITMVGKRDKVCEVGSDIIFMDEKKSQFNSELAVLIC